VRADRSASIDRGDLATGRARDAGLNHPLGVTRGSVAPSMVRTMGPVEFAVIRFADREFGGDRVASAMQAVIDDGAVRVLDLVFVQRDDEGVVSVVELEELPLASLGELDGAAGGLFSDEDIERVAARLEPGTSLALVLLEDLWARPLAEALEETGAALITGGRLPSGAIEAAFQDAVT
jgi:hypothetical protein